MQQINTNFKPHFYLALFLSIWLVLFLIFIAPFDTADLSFTIRVLILPPYGLICLLSYLVLIPIQKWLFEKYNGWNVFFEFALVFIFFCINLLCTFLYYKTPIINGDYSFSQFVTGVFSPIFFLLIGILILARWLLSRLVPMPEKDRKVLLTGANRSDKLQVDPKRIVCLSSAQNYVEIHYLHQGILQKKLLRTTLKTISEELPELIKVHRSHLINPNHFIKWKDNNNIQLEGLVIPVSKNYRASLDNYFKSRPS